MKKPPIGIVPEWLWKQQRIDDLICAIARYIAAEKVPDQRWYDELREKLNEDKASLSTMQYNICSPCVTSTNTPGSL